MSQPVPSPAEIALPGDPPPAVLVSRAVRVSTLQAENDQLRKQVEGLQRHRMPGDLAIAAANLGDTLATMDGSLTDEVGPGLTLGAALAADCNRISSEIARLETLLVKLGEAGGDVCETCHGLQAIVAYTPNEFDPYLTDEQWQDLADSGDYPDCDSPTCFGGWDVAV